MSRWVDFFKPPTVAFTAQHFGAGNLPAIPGQAVAHYFALMKGWAHSWHSSDLTAKSARPDPFSAKDSPERLALPSMESKLISPWSPTHI